MADRTGGHRRDAERLLRRRYDRADFLRLIGAGATLPFVPAILGARPGNAQTIPPPLTPADLVAGGEFPTGLWWPPPPQSKDPLGSSYTTSQRYEQVRQAGFNFVIGGNGVTNDASIPDALNAAEENGLKFLLTDDPGNGAGLQDLIRGAGARTNATRAGARDTEEDVSQSILQYLNEQDDPRSSSDDTVSGLALSDVERRIRSRVQELVGRYGASYPALAGINLFDEPSRKMFGRTKFAKVEVRERFSDDRDLPYANVYPSYAARSALGTRNYGEYLDLYLKGVRPPLLSFDHYPLLEQSDATDDYFYNWAAIRNRALKYGIPSWVLIQSLGLSGTLIGQRRRKPNKDELYWQVNVSLAYGAKGIQHFTYWTPEDHPPIIRFEDALINRDTGEPTATYGRAKEVNEEYLRKVGKQLLPLTSELVMHTGVKKAKPGVQTFKADGWLRAVTGSPLILGRFFQNSLNNAERYLLVANRSPVNATVEGTRLTVADSVVQVSRFDLDAEEFISFTLEGRNLSIRLDAGRAELYKLSRTPPG